MIDGMKLEIFYQKKKSRNDNRTPVNSIKDGII